jgi:hypothetical protein
MNKNIEIGDIVTVRDNDGEWIVVSKFEDKIQLALLADEAISIDAEQIETNFNS